MDAFKESLVEELGTHTAFTIPLFGGIPVADSVVVTWIVMAVLVIAALLLTRNLSVRSPGKVQVALESAVQFLNGFVKTNIGSHWRPFAYYWHLWSDAAHQGHQRDHRSGFDEYAAHLRLPVPV